MNRPRAHSAHARRMLDSARVGRSPSRSLTHSLTRTLMRARMRALMVVTVAASPWRALPAQAVEAVANGRREAMLTVARDIMRAARYCALITRDAAAGASARTIDPAPPDSAMVVRFVTNPRSRKVKQLAVDSRVALYYFDASAQRYATLYGRARVIRDPAEKARRWYEGWTPFYPQRERDATLYEVVPERIELVSPGDSVVGDSVSWATPTIRFPARRARP